METPCQFFLFGAPLLCTGIRYKYHTSAQTLYALTQPRYNSGRASSFALCGSRDRCFCLCVSVCACATQRSYSKQYRNYEHKMWCNVNVFFSAVLSAVAVCVSPRPPRSLYVVAANTLSPHPQPKKKTSPTETPGCEKPNFLAHAGTRASCQRLSQALGRGIKGVLGFVLVRLGRVLHVHAEPGHRHRR